MLNQGYVPHPSHSSRDPDRKSTQDDCGIILKPRAAFGSACGHHKSIYLQSPCTVVSSAGKLIRFWDVFSGSSSFMHVPEADVNSCSAVLISSSGKYSAILQRTSNAVDSDTEPTTAFQLLECVRASTGVQVSIYNLKAQKVVSTVRADKCQTDPGSSLVVDFGMSGGLNKLLFVIWGPEDPILTVYRWYSGEIIASVRDCGVIRAAFEPATDMLLAISDRSIMTISVSQESIEKSIILESHARFTCASFSMGYCVVGDSEGAVTVIQYGNCVAKLDAAATAHAGHEGKTDSTEQSSGCCLVDIAPFEQGFVTATHSGVMSVFMTGEHDRVAHIISLSASATGEVVVLMSNLSDQYVINTTDADANSQVGTIIGENPFEDRAVAPFSLIQKGAHAGSIVAMDAQDMGSLVATAGSDHTVRVYDAATGDCIVGHTVMDDVTAIAFHPVAPLLLVGMHTSLCLFEVLLNDLVCAHEFGYPKSFPITVSSTGHLFAAVVGGYFSIIICETLSGEVVARLKGHASTVTSLSWTHDDQILCSASVDGTVMFWNWQTQQRVQDMEYADKQQQFQSVFAMPTYGHVTVRAQSGILCCIEHGELVKLASGPSGKALGTCLLGSGRVLLVGDTAGNIHCCPWHTKCGESVPTQHSAHSTPLLHMCTCAGQSMLISSATDGTMIVWDLQVIVDGLELPARWHPPAQSAYKVSTPALSQLQQKLRELSRNVVVAEAAAKAKAAMQIKELQETVQNLESEVSNLGRHLDEQEERFDKQRENLTEQFTAQRRASETMHMHACVLLEATFEKRFELERAALKAHLAERDDQRFKIEETLQRLRKAHVEEVLNLQQRMQTQEQAFLARCRALECEGEAAQEEFAEAVQQSEAEFDSNAERMKVQLECVKDDSRQTIEELNAQIQSHTRDNLRLKAEKFQDTRVMTKQRKQIQELEVQLKNESEMSAELQGTLRDHQSMSADNHGLIDELQAKISHLESVSFVMGERAKQFAEEVQPRRREVIELAEQRSHQDKELARTLRMVASLKQAVSHKQEQLRHIKADAVGARTEAGAMQTRLTQMKFDLAAAMLEDDDTLPNGSSRRKLALTVLEKKWHHSLVGAQHRADEPSPDSSMRRQLLAVELMAGLADFRAARCQRSNNAQNAQHVAKNLQLLHENNALRRENQHLRQSLCSAGAGVDGSRLSPRWSQPAHDVSAVSTTAELPGGTCAETDVATSAEDIVEDHRVDDDLDPALVSLGSRVPPLRPTSTTLPPRAPELSLCSQNRITPASRHVSSAPGRKRPQTAVGVVTRKPELGSHQRRPVSAQPVHSAARHHGCMQHKRPVSGRTYSNNSSGRQALPSDTSTIRIVSPQKNMYYVAHAYRDQRSRRQPQVSSLKGETKTAEGSRRDNQQAYGVVPQREVNRTCGLVAGNPRRGHSAVSSTQQGNQR